MTTIVTPPIDGSMRLSRDLAASAATMDRRQIRSMVDLYYQVQQYRITSGNQRRACEASEEPHELIDWSYEVMNTYEKQIARAMGKWVESRRDGRWLIVSDMDRSG